MSAPPSLIAARLCNVAPGERHWARNGSGNLAGRGDTARPDPPRKEDEQSLGNRRRVRH
jgi:hypothetical protein